MTQKHPALDALVDQVLDVLIDPEMRPAILATIQEAKAKNDERDSRVTALRSVSLYHVSTLDSLTELPPPPGYVFEGVQPAGDVDDDGDLYVLVIWRKSSLPTSEG